MILVQERSALMDGSLTARLLWAAFPPPFATKFPQEKSRWPEAARTCGPAPSSHWRGLVREAGAQIPPKAERTWIGGQGGSMDVPRPFWELCDRDGPGSRGNRLSDDLIRLKLPSCVGPSPPSSTPLSCT